MFQQFLDDHNLTPIGRLSKKQAQSLVLLQQQQRLRSINTSPRRVLSRNNGEGDMDDSQFVICNRLPMMSSSLDITTTSSIIIECCLLIGTDGPWDIFKFLVPECLRKGIPIPQWGLHYADVRRHFQYYF